jgi:hypothetical protein
MAQTRNNSRRNTRQYASPEHELVNAARVTISASPDGLSMDLAPILGDERTPLVDPSAGFSGEQTFSVIEIGHQYTNIPDRYPDLVFTAATAKLGMDQKGRASNTEVQDCILVPYINHPSSPRRKQDEKEWEYMKRLEEMTERSRALSQKRSKALAADDMLSGLVSISSFRAVPVIHTYEDGTFTKVFYVNVMWNVSLEEQPVDDSAQEDAANGSSFEDEVLS